MMQRSFLFVTWCTTLLALSEPCIGAVVTGNLNLTGAVQFSSTFIDFTPLGDSGRALVEDGSTGTFAGLIASHAFPADISISPLPPGGLSNEISFEKNAQLHFNLLSAGPGIFGPALCGAVPAPGQMCTLPGTPFNFTNTLNGSTLSVDFVGNFVDLTGTADSTPYHGTFTAQFVSSYQQVLASINSGGTIFAPYAMSFAPSPVPEPSVIFALVTGLFAIGAFRRLSRH